MAVRISDYLGQALCQWLRGITFPAAPSAVYVAISSTGPTAAGVLTEQAARQAVVFSPVQVSEANGGVTSNVGVVVFNGLPAVTITHVAIFDAATGGNMLWFGPLSATQASAGGGSVSFNIDTLRIQMGGLVSNYLAQSLLNWVRGTAMPAAPASVQAAFSRAAPLRTGGGLLEPLAGDGYVRKPIAFSVPVSTVGAGTSISNNADILFGPSVNSGWGTITHLAFFSSTGDMLFSGIAAVPFIVGLGAGKGVANGAFTFTVR